MSSATIKCSEANKPVDQIEGTFNRTVDSGFGTKYGEASLAVRPTTNITDNAFFEAIRSDYYHSGMNRHDFAKSLGIATRSLIGYLTGVQPRTITRFNLAQRVIDRKDMFPALSKFFDPTIPDLLFQTQQDESRLEEGTQRFSDPSPLADPPEPSLAAEPIQKHKNVPFVEALSLDFGNSTRTPREFAQSLGMNSHQLGQFMKGTVPTDDRWHRINVFVSSLSPEFPYLEEHFLHAQESPNSLSKQKQQNEFHLEEGIKLSLAGQTFVERFRYQINLLVIETNKTAELKPYEKKQALRLIENFESSLIGLVAISGGSTAEKWADFAFERNRLFDEAPEWLVNRVMGLFSTDAFQAYGLAIFIELLSRN